MTHIGLFEGIGGFSLAARSMGWHTVAWCQWDKMCQRHLRYHFPEAEGFGDITKTDFTKYADKIDILTGGFPCQPFSQAGKRKGTADTRYLWPEMLRAIREIRPRWIVGENVRGLVNWDGGLVFDTVQADLEAQGYEVLPFLLPACAVDAPHRRDRIWFIAYSGGKRTGNKNRKTDNEGWGSGKDRTSSIRQAYGQTGTGGVGTADTNGFATNPSNERLQFSGPTRTGRTGFEDGDCGGFTANTNGHVGCEGWMYQERPEASAGYPCPCGSCSDQRPNWQNFPTQSPVCGRDDGLPTQLDGVTFSKWRQWSIKSYGNAVVPQVVFQIYKAIQQYQSL